MTMEAMRAFFGWGTILNFLLVTIWFLLYLNAGDWLLRLHNRWFPISREAFVIIHYSGMAGYKVLTWLFFFIPYLVLRFWV